jgi:hypothetical protein
MATTLERLLLATPILLVTNVSDRDAGRTEAAESVWTGTSVEAEMGHV